MAKETLAKLRVSALALGFQSPGKQQTRRCCRHDFESFEGVDGRKGVQSGVGLLCVSLWREWGQAFDCTTMTELWGTHSHPRLSSDKEGPRSIESLLGPG